MGRLVARSFLKKSEDESCKVYRNWANFGTGYIIGRCT